jgi:hypothetical protein
MLQRDAENDIPIDPLAGANLHCPIQVGILEILTRQDEEKSLFGKKAFYSQGWHNLYRFVNYDIIARVA